MSIWDINEGDDLPTESDLEEVGDSLFGTEWELSTDDGDVIVDISGLE